MSAVVTEATSANVSAPEVVNVETLLAPIPGENPAGENLQYSGLHDEIREARRAEDTLAQGDWKREPKTADWHKVFELSKTALEIRTKDLQICAWLDEALVKLHGFVGLRDGLKVMRGLHERFWENVYPEMDEGDLEARANALSWLDRTLAIPIKEIPLTNSSGGVNYNYLQWEDSKKFDIPENLEALDYEQQTRAEEARQRAAEEGKITSEDWRKAKGSSRRAYYEATYTTLNECWEEFEALDRVMDEKFDRQTPGLGALKKSLDEVRTLVEKLVKEKRLLEPDPVTTNGDSAGAAVAADDSGAMDGGQALSTGPVRTRQEALKRLGEVAEFFRRTEPHSPVSYLVQRAIKWGEMPLEVWLGDVIKSADVLDSLRETLGLKAGADGSEADSGGGETPS
ncbi:MAG TPA: type VI secretion system protein TssA [Pyrinomonadaceae bacterium]|jgi:type VI secretion system protein ImpA